MREHFKKDLETSYQVVVGEWNRSRTLLSPAVESACKRIVAAQTADAASVLGGCGKLGADAADEVVSDWWEWALKDDGGFDLYDPTQPFAPWAECVLRFKCLAYLKRRFGGRRRMAVLDFDAAENWPSVAESMETEDRDALVREEVARLSPNLRRAVVSKYWDRESSACAAKKCQAKADDLDRWRFQARAILRKRFRGRVG